MLRSKSLKKNLIFSLLVLMTATFLTAYIVSFFIIKKEIEKVFDANLVKSSKLIFNLIKHEIFEEKDGNYIIDLSGVEQQEIFHNYEYKVHSQIWQNNRLIFNSSKDLTAKKPDYIGFREIIINENKWCSFALYTKLKIY